MKISVAAASLLPILLTAVAAQAQTTSTTTTVNPYTGTVVTTTITSPNAPSNIGDIIANQDIYGESFPGTTTNTTITYSGRPGRCNTGNTYNYYAPPAPSLGIYAPANTSWSHPVVISSIPLGGSLPYVAPCGPAFIGAPLVLPSTTYSYVGGGQGAIGVGIGRQNQTYTNPIQIGRTVNPIQIGNTVNPIQTGNGRQYGQFGRRR